MSAEYRISGRRLRRTGDPEASGDPAVVAVLDQLRTLTTPVAPDPTFRAELRAQLVAITPRIVAESAAEAAPVVGGSGAAVGVLDRPRPSPRPREQPDATPSIGRRAGRFLPDLRRIPLARPLAVAASIVTVLALVLGGAVYLSRDSLPGDTLYGLKRASERFELSRAGSDTARAQKLLEFATTRVDEARRLVARPSASGAGALADGGLSAGTGVLVSDTLSSANDDTLAASRLLGGVAVSKASAEPLMGVKTWAPEQIARLESLRASLPAGDLRTHAAESARIVQAVAARAASLRSTVACHCLKGAPSDTLGPVPTSAHLPAAPAVRAPTSTAPSAPALRTTGGSTSAGTPAQPTDSGTTRGGTSSTPASRTTGPGLTLPTLPPMQPSQPSASGSSLTGLCQITLLGIRLCPTSPR